MAIGPVHQKRVDLNKTKRSSSSFPGCIGHAAMELARKLKKKYGPAPKLVALIFAGENSGDDEGESA